jgi:integrase
MPVLTVPSIEKYAKKKVRREIPDTKAVGLFLIIQPSGSKSWALRFRRPDGRTAKMTLGPVDLSVKEVEVEPKIGEPLTLGQARQLAATIARQRARNLDPIVEHAAEKDRQRKAAIAAIADAFGACSKEFFIKYRTSPKRGGKRPRRWREDAALIGLEYPLDCDPAKVEPVVVKGSLADLWATKPVSQITGHDIHTVITEARKRGDGRARKLFSALSTLFGWLLEEHRRVAINPCIGVFCPKPPESRDRVLSDDEIRWFWLATERVGAPAGALLKVLLLTGCRLREVSGMVRSELPDADWTIPGNRTKNNRPLSLSLPPLALQIIDSVPHIGDTCVFTVNGRKPLSNFSGLKRQLDAEMAKIAGHAVKPWRLHDLRRSMATGMAKLGVPLPVTEKLLNHVSGSFAGVAGIYDRYEYADEKADALRRWARHVEGLVTDKPDNVIGMASKRGRK